MSSNHKIYKRKSDNSYKLEIGCKEIYNNIIKLGGCERKSLVAEFPDVPDEYLRHFIRGYFDGDGGVSYNKINKYLIVSFTGTDNMMIGIQNRLICGCGLNKVKLSCRHPERNNNIRTLLYSGNVNTRKICDYFYKNITTNLYIERKKNKFYKQFNIDER